MAPPGPPSDRGRWGLLALVTGAHTLGAVSVLAVAPLAPLLLEHLPLPRAHVGPLLPRPAAAGGPAPHTGAGRPLPSRHLPRRRRHVAARGVVHRPLRRPAHPGRGAMRERRARRPRRRGRDA